MATTVTMDKNAALRVLRALTMTKQEDFAKVVGVHRPELSHFETEKAIVPVEVEQRLIERLGIRLSDPRLIELVTIRDELDTAIKDYLKPTVA